jgi:carbonic anhydrase/acetyltransferase-like protein (isoleucine patch superfamily)
MMNVASKNIRVYRDKSPQLGERVFIDDAAVVIGDVTIGDDTSVWPATVIRGDMHWIRIGKRCSIQDGSVLHITHAYAQHPNGFPLTVGDDCTIGHKVCLHGCAIGNRVLVGIGAIVLDGAVVADDVMIGAGTVVPPGKKLDSGFLYVGNPCKQLRTLRDDEKHFLRYSPQNYVKLKDEFLLQQ